MYFTQEDYIKIENWLQANSVKDTEFPEASSLSLNEQLTIIQRGENKRIKLEDLVNFLFSQSDSELDTSSTKPIQNQAVARAIYELQNRKFIEIVEELPPTSNAKDNVVYILLDKVGEDNNLFTEWIKVNNTWEKVGEFKAEIDLSPYLKIQDSPFEKGSADNSAVLKGGNNQVTNANEVALGKYNISNSDTQFSIGIGTSDTDRKNAVEVKANGDIYIEGVEGRIQDNLNATNILDGQLTELSNKVDNLPQGDDFDKQGNYPLLHVGTSDDLAGRGESVPAEFGFRASGGKSIKDGRAYIKRIKGNSVVWNQYCESAQSRTHNGVTFTNNGDGSWTINGTAEGGTALVVISKLLKNKRHKWLITGLEGGSQTTYYAGDGRYINSYKGICDTSAESVDETNITLRVVAGASVENVKVYPRIYDLTQMFQAGNEPTTIEDFNARVATLGVDMNAYNEGEVIHCNTESIKSVGDNAWDEEWRNGHYDSTTGVYNNSSQSVCNVNPIKVLPNQEYYNTRAADEYIESYAFFYDADMNFISYASMGRGTFTTPANSAYMNFYFTASYYGTTYKNDIMITLVHSGWKQDTDAGYQPYWQDTLPTPIIRKYFPDGMKSAGTAHDEIRYNKVTQKWEYSKERFRSVDLGTLNWGWNETYGGFLSTGNTGFAIKWSGLCAKYKYGGGYNRLKDKEIGYIYETSIIIKDSAYTDAASFKAMLQEQQVVLYYESNDWEWVELDAEDQNFRDYYNVADFGTEMSQSSVPSAPFSADIIYQFNAVDMIREHELEITELQSIIATMQAQLASLTSNH